MSTKIYNAFEYCGFIDGAMNYLVKLRNEYKGVVLQWCKDNFTLKELQNENLDIELKRRIQSPYLIDDSPKVEVIVIPFQSRIYFVAFGNIWINERFERELHDFHYQNQTDPPENVSEHDWTHRKIVWEHIMEERGDHFYEMGMTYEIWGSDWDVYCTVSELRKEFKCNNES